MKPLTEIVREEKDPVYIMLKKKPYERIVLYEKTH